jgi:hypothetical protein
VATVCARGSESERGRRQATCRDERERADRNIQREKRKRWAGEGAGIGGRLVSINYHIVVRGADTRCSAMVTNRRRIHGRCCSALI